MPQMTTRSGFVEGDSLSKTDRMIRSGFVSSELKSVRTELFMARSRLINHAEVVLSVLILMFTLEPFSRLNEHTAVTPSENLSEVLAFIRPMDRALAHEGRMEALPAPIILVLVPSCRSRQCHLPSIANSQIERAFRGQGHQCNLQYVIGGPQDLPLSEYVVYGRTRKGISLLARTTLGFFMCLACRGAGATATFFRFPSIIVKESNESDIELAAHLDKDKVCTMTSVGMQMASA